LPRFPGICGCARADWRPRGDIWKQLVQALARHFGKLDAEQLLGCRIHADHDAIVVHDQYAIGDRIEHAGLAQQAILLDRFGKRRRLVIDFMHARRPFSIHSALLHSL
jgi:hypothetical protein